MQTNTLGSGMTLPNFVVIGAAKCGTTSLHEYLAAHPEIFMSRQKELHFFLIHEPWGSWNRGVEWYAAQFSLGVDYPVRGESSPGYSIGPITESVVERMVQLLPHARLAYGVRDPIERIRSHYTEELYGGRLPPEISLNDIIQSGPEGQGLLGHYYRVFVETSMYYRQITRYLRHYSLQDIHIYTAETLGKDPAQTLREVYNFLEVNSDFVNGNLFERLNEREGKRLRIRDPLAHLRHFPGYEELSSHVPQGLKRWYSRTTGKKVNHELLTQISPSNLTHLEEKLGPDILRFRELTGQSLEGWQL